jgi:hypothetical protein
LIGALTLFLAQPLTYYFNFRGSLVLIFGSGSFLIGTGFLLFAYLRGDLISSAKLSRDVYDTLVRNRTVESFPDDLLRLSSELLILKEVVAKVQSDPGRLKELNADERASLRSELKTQLEGVLANDLVVQIEEKYSAKIADDAQASQIRKGFEITSLRLRQEIAALSRRSNVNLVIGVLTTVVAVAMLAYLVWGSRVTFTTLPDLLSHFIPRISVAAFIEVFSFFFLKLYKSNLEEIKYFQNELTNVEMRIIAYEAALLSQENKSIPPIIEQLIRTDRNIMLPAQTLSKNDTRQLEPKDIAELLDKLGKLLSVGTHK